MAMKSGWDENGIAFGRCSYDITIQSVIGLSPFAGFAIDSETSCGVEILTEHINLFDMGVGIHIKTNSARGRLIKNIIMSHVYMEN